ncbi:hypothetical protein WMO40_21120 [Bacillaceae bacterium CLA-AA-H227]|uniref:Uncharacterized protein n=1 Tax=Robertmurraya yapensis (ex Hitch et al 2024) TaxID=3133160 RepID=A0ACC6SJI6_9BACI
MENIDLEREELIGWCSLLSSYKEEYFERKTLEELREVYKDLSDNS